MRTIQTQKEYIERTHGSEHATKAAARAAWRKMIASAAVAKKVCGGWALFASVTEFDTWSAQC